MLRKTFLGATISCVISQTAYSISAFQPRIQPRSTTLTKRTVSKSMEVNLNSRRKRGGTRRLVLRCDEDMISAEDGRVDMLSSAVGGRDLHVLCHSGGKGKTEQ